MTVHVTATDGGRRATSVNNGRRGRTDVNTSLYFRGPTRTPARQMAFRRSGVRLPSGYPHTLGSTRPEIEFGLIVNGTGGLVDRSPFAQSRNGRAGADCDGGRNQPCRPRATASSLTSSLSACQATVITHTQNNTTRRRLAQPTSPITPGGGPSKPETADHREVDRTWRRARRTSLTAKPDHPG